jgi:hypothetical protein
MPRVRHVVCIHHIIGNQLNIVLKRKVIWIQAFRNNLEANLGSAINITGKSEELLMAGAGAADARGLHDGPGGDIDEDLGTLGDLLPSFLDELGDYELLAGALGGHLDEDHLHDSSASVAPLLPPPSEVHGEKDPENKRPPMQNSTRRRQKQELSYLRAKVAELERNLAGLKTQLMRSKSSATTEEARAEGSRTDASNDGVLALRRASRWERIAKHQLVEKQRAERQNLKLREMLETQIKVARSLEKVLKKRPNAMVRCLSTCVLSLSVRKVTN